VSDATGIQWTDSTWNVVTGCTRVSPGCARCYIERTPPFRMQHRRFATVDAASTTGVTLHWERLDKPPRGPKVFTPSLGDLFHEDVPDEFVAAVFDSMRLHPDRQFQVLTKRPQRAAELLPELYDYAGRFEINDYAHDGQPLPNVWLGVSIENARYTWRADVLREIPAAVRFISAEPLLGSLFPDIRLHPQRAKIMRALADGLTARETAQLFGIAPSTVRWHAKESRSRPLDLTGIDWVIIGGESGPSARPFHLEHARELLDHCGACDPYDGRDRPAIFVKQLGAKPIIRHPYIAGVADAYSGLELHDRKGGDIDEWPADLRIREFPRTAVPT